MAVEEIQVIFKIKSKVQGDLLRCIIKITFKIYLSSRHLL